MELMAFFVIIFHICAPRGKDGSTITTYGYWRCLGASTLLQTPYRQSRQMAAHADYHEGGQGRALEWIKKS